MKRQIMAARWKSGREKPRPRHAQRNALAAQEAAARRVLEEELAGLRDEREK